MATMDITKDMRQKAIDYKKSVAGKFMLVEGAKIKSRLVGEDFAVTRKIDGHMQCLFYNEGAVVMLNSNGVQKAEGLKCLDIFAKFMEKAGVKSAIIAAELYLPVEDGRPRCSDVGRALADEELRSKLALAAFDIIEINGEPYSSEHYKTTHAELVRLLSITIVNDEGSGATKSIKKITKTSSLCKPVEMRAATSVDEVAAIFAEWVEGEGAEGIVVHNETHIVSKIKPRHSIDAVCVGYTTADRGIRDLMFAVRREDGKYQMFACGSSGMSDEDREAIAVRLAAKHVESQYVLSDSRGIAYQMVVPEIVFEIRVLELVASSNDGKIKTNPLLTYDQTQGWLLEGMTPGVSVSGFALQRERTDKSIAISDVRLSQLTDLCPFEESEGGAAELAKSVLVARRVFKKVAKDKVMIHKFLVWKSNKEASGDYPAYVFYHTDYSSSRKELIKRDMAFSSSREQIMNILEAEIADNIKKGWEEIV